MATIRRKVQPESTTGSVLSTAAARIQDVLAPAFEGGLSMIEADFRRAMEPTPKNSGPDIRTLMKEVRRATKDFHKARRAYQAAVKKVGRATGKKGKATTEAAMASCWQALSQGAQIIMTKKVYCQTMSKRHVDMASFFMANWYNDIAAECEDVIRFWQTFVEKHGPAKAAS